MMKWFTILAVTSACSGTPMAPTPDVRPLALSGQSQVVLLVPALAPRYPGRLVGAWEGGRSIAFWGPDDRMWRALAPTLHEPLRAFVWWQGESDCDGLASAVPDYAQRFPELMARIRAEAGDPNLFVVVITVSPVPICTNVRAVQAAWIAADHNALLLSADDIPRENWPADIHITAAGAQVVAARIVDALRGR